MAWLIKAAQLDKFRKTQKNIIIMDATWFLPQSQRQAKEAFALQHIIDAKFFAMELFHEHPSQQPHDNMVITDVEAINAKLGSLSIRNESRIIFYDNSDIHTACRAVWMMQLFGHPTQQLYILDGGLQAWKDYGGKVESGEPNYTTKTYTADLDLTLLRNLSQMKSNLYQPCEQVIDLRHAVRYAGGPELKPHLRSGHIPGSFSFPVKSFFEKDGTFKPLDKLKQQLNAMGVDLKAPIVSTCGSGMSAPCLLYTSPSPRD